MSKFLEAVRRAASEGMKSAKDPDGISALAIGDRIAQRYGDLEFTREDVRGMLEEGMEFAHCNRAPFYNWIYGEIDHILSRHTEGESESGEKDQHDFEETVARLIDEDVDDTPAIKASEIERLTGEKVPEWAEWIAKDHDGMSAFFSHEPSSVAGVWGMSGEAQARWAKTSIEGLGHWKNSLRRIIHDEPEETPTIKASEIGNLNRLVVKIHGDLIALTKRVAVIEKRVLADGHSRTCKYAVYINGECTCGYDELREARKA